MVERQYEIFADPYQAREGYQFLYSKWNSDREAMGWRWNDRTS